VITNKKTPAYARAVYEAIKALQNFPMQLPLSRWTGPMTKNITNDIGADNRGCEICLII